jgi:hypothetical protein
MSFGVLDEDGLAKTWLKHSIPLKTIPKRDYKPVIIVNGLKIPQQAKHEPHSSDSTGGAKAVSRANQTASVGGSDLKVSFQTDRSFVGSEHWIPISGQERDAASPAGGHRTRFPPGSAV